MSHLHGKHQKLIDRVRRIAGQVAAVERNLEADADCTAILHLVAAVRGAVNGLMDEIVEEHIREHVACEGLSDEERQIAAEELITAIRRYNK